MTDRVLSDAEIEKMQTPLWEQAKAAIDAGDAEAAKALIDRAVAQWAGLKDYSINWITTPAHVHRRRARRGGRRARAAQDRRRVRAARAATPAPTWGDLPGGAAGEGDRPRRCSPTWARSRSTRTTRRSCSSFRCGSGGKLIDDGRYEGEHPYRDAARSRSGRTFARDELLGLLRALLGEQRDPAGRVGRGADEHRVPAASGRASAASTTSTRTCGAIPAEAYVRIGKRPPRPPSDGLDAASTSARMPSSRRTCGPSPAGDRTPSTAASSPAAVRGRTPHSASTVRPVTASKRATRSRSVISVSSPRRAVGRAGSAAAVASSALDRVVDVDAGR